MHSCFDVARFFLSKTNTDAEEGFTNLKLQKLVYYVQAYSLGIWGVPFIEEAFEAWQHGPVCRKLYNHYKKYGAKTIPKEECDTSIFSAQEEGFLEEVYEHMGQFSAYKLRAISHSEQPWRDAYKLETEIPHDAMRDFYSKLVHRKKT